MNEGFLNEQDRRILDRLVDRLDLVLYQDRRSDHLVTTEIMLCVAGGAFIKQKLYHSKPCSTFTRLDSNIFKTPQILFGTP